MTARAKPLSASANRVREQEQISELYLDTLAQGVRRTEAAHREALAELKALPASATEDERSASLGCVHFAMCERIAALDCYFVLSERFRRGGTP